MRCTNDKASGVIVGWDESPNAPPEIMVDIVKGGLNNAPHYLILMDSVSASVSYDQLRYLAQNEIEAKDGANKGILNLELSRYFEGFHNDKYIMRPWLRSVYPRD